MPLFRRRKTPPVEEYGKYQKEKRELELEREGLKRKEEITDIRKDIRVRKERIKGKKPPGIMSTIVSNIRGAPPSAAPRRIKRKKKKKRRRAPRVRPINSAGPRYDPWETSPW